MASTLPPTRHPSRANNTPKSVRKQALVRQARRAHLDADEAEGGGEEPNSPGHQHRHGDPQPRRFAVPAQQRLAAKALASTKPISNTNITISQGKEKFTCALGFGEFGIARAVRVLVLDGRLGAPREFRIFIWWRLAFQFHYLQSSSAYEPALSFWKLE